MIGVRDRMDASPGFGRTVRDARFRYVRHFLPWIPGDDLPDYATGVPITGELRAARAAGTLPPGACWFARATRPSEELFDVVADHEELVDLAADPGHAADLARLRGALRDWMRETRDTGILPESILRREARAAGSEWAIFHPPGDAVAATQRYDAIFAAAWDVAEPLPLDHHARRLDDPDAAVRFWAASGVAWSALRPDAPGDRSAAAAALVPLLSDADPAVRINAARWICRLEPADDAPQALAVLAAGMQSDDPDVRVAALVSIDEIGELGRPLWETVATLQLGKGEEYSRRTVERIRARLRAAR
ncbi:MAG: hypothetical protein EBZ59_13570 [Planctomycetia bacterium]|nr:hypothetical protein [Planctomycetia bacterium]